MQQQKNQITVFVFNLIAVIFLISLRLLIFLHHPSLQNVRNSTCFISSHHIIKKQNKKKKDIMSADRLEAHKINDLKFERHTHTIYHMAVSSIR